MVRERSRDGMTLGKAACSDNHGCRGWGEMQRADGGTRNAVALGSLEVEVECNTD